MGKGNLQLESDYKFRCNLAQMLLHQDEYPIYRTRLFYDLCKRYNVDSKFIKDNNIVKQPLENLIEG